MVHHLKYRGIAGLGGGEQRAGEGKLGERRKLQLVHQFIKRQRSLLLICKVGAVAHIFKAVLDVEFLLRVVAHRIKRQVRKDIAYIAARKEVVIRIGKKVAAVLRANRKIAQLFLAEVMRYLNIGIENIFEAAVIVCENTHQPLDIVAELLIYAGEQKLGVFLIAGKWSFAAFIGKMCEDVHK